eukprot:TRINITY_DN27790_c0_g1_i1.p1 TRINITY_DN27790_c0_g1~~TRINITY_DN27790_c0_g1_i1.p1  ORF type:complete len:113 (+),score=32.27 TRINITY_DN27790_c0_g1_i1:119-457(+)
MGLRGAPKFDDGPPEDFDPARPYADPVAMLEQREWSVREKLVQMEQAKILREKVKECYRQEGINHHKNCRDLVHRYLAMTPTLGWGKDMRVIGGPAPKAKAEEVEEDADDSE